MHNNTILGTTLLAILAACTPNIPDTKPASSKTIPTSHNPTQRNSAVRIQFLDDSTCSGTILGPNTILSATHCFTNTTTNIRVDNFPATIQRILDDGNDHVLVLVKTEHPMTPHASIGPPPKQGDNIHYWGNPHVFSMLLRKGYVSGFDGFNTLYDVNGFHGDSGAGVFNDKQQLVATISYIQGKRTFSILGSFPFNFTTEQIQAAKLQHNQFLNTGIKVNVHIQ